jgi:hypothetical protein
LLRALVKVDEDETPHGAFYEGWDGHREEAGPFNQVATDSHEPERGLIEARQESERIHELGNDCPMVSPQLIVEGVTAAGRAFVNDQCGSPID